MGEGLLTFYRQKIKQEWKTAFLTVLILGLCVHIYKFTNALPNKDTLYNFYSDQNVITSGRWLLSLACGISSYYDLPWLNGLMSLIFIGGTAALLTDIFRMKNPVLIVLSSGLLVAFPGITETFFYEYTADGYMIAMFLATLAVWLTPVEKPGLFRTLAAAVCIACSCAIYQSYVCFALVLSLCCLFLSLLDGQNFRGGVFWQTVPYLLGLAVYYGIWKLLMALSGQTANDYQGISTLSLSLGTILSAVAETVKTIAIFFLEWDVLEHGWTVYSVLNVLFLLAFLGGLVLAVIRSGLLRRKGSLLLAALCLIAMPFAVCLWSFASREVVYRPMMLQSICVLFLFSAVLYERWAPPLGKNAFALLLAVILFNYGVMANIAYYYMNRSYHTTFATASEIQARIHLLDTDSNQVAVIGSVPASLVYQGHATQIPLFGQLLETDMLFNDWNLVNFMNETFYCWYDFADLEAAMAEEDFRETVSRMGCWPASDSLQEKNGIIIIKLSNDY